jgi:aspartate/methionine/tyrosine aminotransferase
VLPINTNNINLALNKLGIVSLESATIQQIRVLVTELEQSSGEHFVHLELGDPGLAPLQVGVRAQSAALKRGVAGYYPKIEGVKTLKKAGSQFLKLFHNIDLEPQYFVPTAGSAFGSFSLLLLLKNLYPDKQKLLIFGPAFPLHINQAILLGFTPVIIDIDDYHGTKLADKINETLANNDVAGMIYSVPNNPSWLTLSLNELQIIGEIASQHSLIVIEDQSNCGMDFRTDYSVPGREPYIPTIARFTNLYAILLSASKIFSYAGERIGLVCLSPDAYNLPIDSMHDKFHTSNLGDSYIYALLGNVTAGTSNSAQHALTAMLDAACDGAVDFIDDAREYDLRCTLTKQAFLEVGFHFIYAKDDNDQTISNGLSFTVGFDDMSSAELQKNLLMFGISTLSLKPTGSSRNGVAVSVASLTSPDIFADLQNRLRLFSLHFNKNN